MEGDSYAGAYEHRHHEALSLEKPDDRLEGGVGEEGRDEADDETTSFVGDLRFLAEED